MAPLRDDKRPAVYMLTNEHHTVLYTGVTSNLKGRVYQHREKLLRGFTNRYNVSKLVYYEMAENMAAAIAREEADQSGIASEKNRAGKCVQSGMA